VDFAHERGVLHRDLKPANIMLGGHGEVYVLDWGVAKVRSASRTFESSSTLAIALPFPGDSSPRDVVGAEKSSPTAAGAVLGTPGYMAPEQLLGGDVDARTDVYALGGILFEILTHQPLHGGGTLSAMMKRALEGADARTSVRAPDRDVAPELEAVCVSACAKDRSRRYASPRQLADAIEAYLSGDRDLELRRSLARSHLARARTVAARALLPGAPNTERSEALREIGRAVALDPEDRTALALLVTMLTDPPKETPPEVAEAVEASRRESQRRMLPRVFLFYTLSWALFLPFQAYLGILDINLIMLPIGAWTIAALGVLWAYKRFRQAQQLLVYLTVLSAAACGLSSLLFGPLLIVPTIVVMSTMGTILMTRRDRRPFLLLCNGLALLVPTAMAWLGVHPVSHVVIGNRTLAVNMAAIAITRDGAFAILTVSNVALFFIGAIFAARYRDALTAAETKNELQAWQLRQMVPAEASRALEPRSK